MSGLALGTVSAQTVRELSSAREDPAWLRELRLRAFESYASLPAERSEMYRKYADVSAVRLGTLDPLAREPEKNVGEVEQMLAAAQDIPALIHVSGGATRVNLPEALRQRGVVLAEIGDLLRDRDEVVRPRFANKAILPDSDKFAALNYAFFQTGLFLYLPPDVEVRLPFRLLTLTDAAPSGIFAHNMIIAEAGSRATILQEQYSLNEAPRTEQSLVSEITEVYLGTGAEVKLAVMQNYNEDIVVFSNRRSVGGGDSRMVWTGGTLGGGLTRIHLDSLLRQPGATAEVVEVVFGSGSQRFDMVSDLSHRGPNTTGSTVSRGVLRDKARSIFKGMIRIDQGAKNSNAYLAEHAMLLSPDARSIAIPGLEIETNEVKATHSASVAQIDEEQVFYLQSRGLPLEEAKKMIVLGFFDPAIQRVPIAVIREQIQRLVDEKWQGLHSIFSFGALQVSELEPAEGEEGPRDIFAGHYKYR